MYSVRVLYTVYDKCINFIGIGNMNLLNIAKLLVAKFEGKGYETTTVSETEMEIAGEICEIMNHYVSETVEKDIILSSSRV